MSEILLPFDEALCPKCGAGEAHMQYCDGVRGGGYWTGNLPPEYGPSECPVEREHHHRTCEQCCYRWLEAVWDGDALLEEGEALGAVEYPPAESVYREFPLDDNLPLGMAFALAEGTAYEAGYEVNGAELWLSPMSWYWLGVQIGKDGKRQQPPKEWHGRFGTVYLMIGNHTVLRCQRKAAKEARHD